MAEGTQDNRVRTAEEAKRVVESVLNAIEQKASADSISATLYSVTGVALEGKSITNAMLEAHDSVRSARKIFAQAQKKGFSPVLARAESMVEELLVHAKGARFAVKEVEHPQASVHKEEAISWSDKLYGVDFEKFLENAMAGHYKNYPLMRHLRASSVSLPVKLPKGELEVVSRLDLVPRCLSDAEQVKMLASRDNPSLQLGSATERKEILQQDSFTSQELAHLDLVLRPGKSSQAHIVYFLPTSKTHYYERYLKELSELAFVTGATLHVCNYPSSSNAGKAGHKLECVYTGIAMVNSLLDDGVHPSDIIAYAEGDGQDVARVVVQQFKQQGGLNLGLLCKEGCMSFVSFDAEYQKKMQSLSNDLAQKGVSPDVLNLMIKAREEVVAKDRGVRGPDLPHDRVTDVRGLIETKKERSLSR